MAKHQRRAKEATTQRAKAIRTGIYEVYNGRRSNDQRRRTKTSKRHESILSTTAKTSKIALPYRLFAGSGKKCQNAIYALPYRCQDTRFIVLLSKRAFLGGSMVEQGTNH